MMQPNGSPQVIVHDKVDVEYSQFCLQDMARIHSALTAEVSDSDWLVVGAQGGVLFHSTVDYHSPAVRLELWKEAPTALPEAWSATGEGAFVADSTELRLWSVMAATGEHTLALPAPGPYQVRAFVWCTEDEADDEDDFGDETHDDVERWLIQIWPA